MISMVWKQGKNKLKNVGFWFWRSKQTRRNEHTCSNSRYQVYTGHPEWSVIRLRVKRDATKINYNVHIQLKDESVNWFDGKYAIDITTLEEDDPPIYVQFDYFMKKEVLKNKDLLQFDISLNTEKRILLSRTSTTEIRSFSLPTPIQKQTIYVPMTSFEEEIFYVPVETDIFENAHVKFRNVSELCEREEEFVTKRSDVILKNMRDRLGFKNLLDEKNAPTIAVIGSGGGMRAVIGMCGAMTALKENGILDSTMYTAGSSGSAWYLLALFSNGSHHNLKRLTDFIRKNLQSVSQTKCIILCLAWLWRENISSLIMNKSMDDSFTDTLGGLIGDVLNEKDVDYLSNQQDTLEDGSVPLPLIAALRYIDANTNNIYNDWIELSPYEAFLPKYGAAMDMENFGDIIFGGFRLDDLDEKTIKFLQGMCGGGFPIHKYVKRPEGKWYRSWRGIKNRISTTSDKYLGKVPNMLRGITTIQPLAKNLDKNEMGTDIGDCNTENIMLVDPGIGSFNSPYPTVLHPSRKVDVILSFDFSNRHADKEWPFEELELAEKWAKKKGVPFPKLYPKLDRIKEEWNRGLYEEVYVFPGDNAPTIVHFVMINKSFRKTDIGKYDFDILPDYSTLKFHYSKQQFDQLYLLVEHNVRVNNTLILDCIKEVIDRKQQETYDSEQKNGTITEQNGS